ncbi:MAG: hypothetical protein AAFR12_02150 [Cyanobacteria bacterium J06626_6]
MALATFSTSVEAQQAAALLEAYHFELGHHDAPQWISLWLEFYRPAWIRDAVIEALYQGRYKSISVRQILELWQRRGQPIRHVTHDFEAAVCREFGGAKLTTKVVPAKTPAPQREPNLTRASRRTHQSLSSISFNLSEKHASKGQSADSPSHPDGPVVAATANGHERSDLAAETAEILKEQRQLNGILSPSARAIQPFKPALPFSAQTLRLAKQNALALSNIGN